MLKHLEQQCLALTVWDNKTKMKDVNIPWECDDDIETYFVKWRNTSKRIMALNG